MVDIINYYAGIGSRETPSDIQNKMTEISAILENLNYILRSGGATGADTAFEIGIVNKKNMNIYLPTFNFNGHTPNNLSHIYIAEDRSNKDYQSAYESLKYHPTGFRMRLKVRNMMIRNYFQAFGHNSLPKSKFIICWTPDAANGSTIKTTYDTGGSGQAIRLAAAHNIPVYNLKDKRYEGLNAQEIVDIILFNLENNINPNVIKSVTTTTSLF